MAIELASGWAWLAAAGASLALTGCDWAKPKAPGAAEHSAQRKLADRRRLNEACGSAHTYDRLKALAFDDVGKIGRGDPRLLDSIAANATIRMVDPIAKSRDEALDVTVCEGHLVLDLPPGVQDAFNGNRRLEADVEYSAQQAADGSGLVYQMRGAEPIVYRLAALTLPNGAEQRMAAARTPPLPAPVRAATEKALPASTAPVATPPEAPSRPPVRAEPAPPAPTAAVAVATARTRAPAVSRSPAPEVAQRPAPESGTARPSFDCGRVTSHVLRMVCSDAGLAAQDRRMSSAFYAALANGGPSSRAALRAGRDRFLSSRNRCSTRACVSDAYERRVAEIRDVGDGDR